MKLENTAQEQLVQTTVTVGGGLIGAAVWVEWIESHVVIWLTSAVLAVQLVYWIRKVVKLGKTSKEKK